MRWFESCSLNYIVVLLFSVALLQYYYCVLLYCASRGCRSPVVLQRWDVRSEPAVDLGGMSYGEIYGL